MSEHASGFFNRQLDTTVAYLLDTSIESAQKLINDFRTIGETDASTLAIVSDLIVTSMNSTTLSDDVELPSTPAGAFL